MAETFVAVRRGPGGFEQKVCIKRVLPAYAEDSEFIEGFLREARTSAALRHANIVQVLDFGQVDESYYLALELIDGLDLRALLAASGEGERRTLTPELVTFIAGELAAALEHAHGAGPDREPVVHRDVSPSNVLVSPAGEVKLTDFGIARALGGVHLTSTGVIKGKVPYLPPEYIERGEFDQRSDLFSLGVLLFELLAGERPFDGESDLDTVRRIVGGERVHLSDLAPHVPPALAACVERLISGHPASRYDSARAFVEALPAVSTHAARRELGQLVELRMRATRASGRVSTRVPPPAQPEPDDPGRARTLTAPAAAPAPPRAPAVSTRTRRPAPKRASERHVGRMVALGAAGLALSALLIGSALKGHDTLAGARATDGVSPPGPNVTPTAPEDAGAAANKPPSPPPAESAPPARDARGLDALSAAREQTAEKPVRLADLRVVVYPFGDVWIDGKPLGHAPVSLKVPSGTHEIGVGDGRPEQRRSVQVHAGEHENLVFRRDIETR